MDAFDRISDKFADKWNDYIEQDKKKREEKDGNSRV